MGRRALRFYFDYLFKKSKIKIKKKRKKLLIYNNSSRHDTNASGESRNEYFPKRKKQNKTKNKKQKKGEE